MVSFASPGNRVHATPAYRSALADRLMLNAFTPDTSPVQSTGEALARAGTSLAQALMAKNIEAKREAREGKASSDLAEAMRGAQAKPWVNPDTGGAYSLEPSGDYDVPDPSRPDERMPIMNKVASPPAGGIDGLVAALARIDNPDLAPFLQQVQMAGIQNQETQRLAAIDRDAKRADADLAHRRSLETKAAPGWEAPRKPVPGVDVPLPPDVFNQNVAIAGARADATRDPLRDVPPGYSPTPTGLAPTTGGPADPAIIAAQEEAKKAATAAAAAGKPVPVAVLKMERDEREAVNTTEGISENLNKYLGLIESGKLDLGMVSNWLARGKNAAGMSDEQSRNFSSFMSDMEKLRNDSLRLNNGVQTDGDAQRAWNELIQNINDPDVVKQRLKEIDHINRRGAALKQQSLDVLYGQYPGLTKGRDTPASPPAKTSRLPEGVSEEDIQETMRANNMTRAQVMERLGIK